jgi:NAD(P)H-nitrite reductase large subunit
MNRGMHIVIIGNGPAGNSAAEAVRRADQEATITLISEEPVPEYSPCVLPNFVAGEIDRKKVFIKQHADYRRHGISPILGEKVEAVHTVEKRIALRKKWIHYDKLIIATGATPVSPQTKGVKSVPSLTLKTLADAETIRNFQHLDRLLIVGGGVIGIELAAAARKRGIDVSVLEYETSLLPRVFTAGFGAVIEKILHTKGIRALTGEKLTEIKSSTRGLTALTDKRAVPCDAVAFTVGVKPNVNLAVAGGIRTGELGGIITDSTMSTSIPDVWACGDCVESTDMVSGAQVSSMLWPNAVTQGRIAGLNCIGIQRRYPGSINLTTLDLFGVKAVSMGKIAGKGRSGQEEETIQQRTSDFMASYHFANGALVGFEMLGDVKTAGPLFQCLLKRSSLEDFDSFLEKRGRVFTNRGGDNMGCCHLW